MKNFSAHARQITLEQPPDLSLGEKVKTQAGKLGIAVLALLGVAGVLPPVLSVNIPDAIADISQNDCSTHLNPQTLVEARHSVETAMPSNKFRAEDHYPYRLTDEYKQRVNTEAQAHGIELVAPASYVDSLEQAQDAAAVLAVVNDFTRQYGFDVKLLYPGSKSQYPDFKPIELLLSTSYFKEQAVNFIEGIYPIPKRLIEYSGVKTLVIAGSIDVNHIEGGKIMNHDTVALLESNFGDRQIFNHEVIGHLVEGRRCGEFGSGRDSNWNHLDSIRKPYEVNVVRSDGNKNLNEKKATFAELAGSGIDDCLLRSNDGSMRIIKEQLVLSLAAWEQLVPGISRYYSGVGFSDTKESRGTVDYPICR